MIDSASDNTGLPRFPGRGYNAGGRDSGLQPDSRKGEVMRRAWMVILLAVILTACAPGGSPVSRMTDDAAAPVSERIDWDRSPDAVIFRVDSGTTGGDPASIRNAVPLCTIFGDGHIVWVNPGIMPEEVLEDRLDEATMRAFLEEVVLAGFYYWEPQIIGTPAPAAGSLLREYILLALFGEPHMVTADSNWPPNAFADLLARCRGLSTTPVLYVPTGAWVSAMPVPEEIHLPAISWAGYAVRFPDVRLVDIPPEKPRWVTGDLAAAAWNLARQGRLHIREEGIVYRLLVEVPGLQPAAPAAP